jgi:hypothetical protein
MSDVLVPEIVNNYDKAITLAIETKADLPTIEKFMDLRERWEKNEARKAYHVAMAEFKAHLPTVVKDKTNSQYKSKYASEDALINTINPELSKHGLSASFDLNQVSDDIKVTCNITHADGHRESVSLSAKADGSGSKNPLQQIKSTTTYLRKATFEAVLGIASSENDADDDGNGSSTIAYISDKQKSSIIDMFNSLELSEGQKSNFFKLMAIEKDDFDKIKESDFLKAMTTLKATQQAKGKK